MEKLELPMGKNNYLMINPDYFEDIRVELEDFLYGEDGLNSKDFVRKILFNQEIKTNNAVEGINNDLLIIENVIKNNLMIGNDKKRREIINLYNGYKYIFTNNIMDKEHLLELYKILSDGLLSSSDMARMGEYYREDKVYILRKGRIDMELSEGIDYSLIDKYMDIYFAYVNDNSDKTMTDKFIKSQIMHFYFVYIHPYFDVNGRSSRTMAMWYLLNNKAYPYIIFNRAISNNSSTYDETITDTRNNANISFFIRYMMINVKRELEKELIIQEIRDNTSVKMTMMDYQALNYILSMKGEKNVLTFTSLYRRDNGYKRVRDVYLQILLPLIDKKIIEIVRTTNKEMFSGYNNEVFRINTSRFDVDNPKIKRLNLRGN